MIYRLSKAMDNGYFASLLKKGNLILWGLLSTVFLNRALGPSLRGEYAYYMNLISLIVIVCGWGLSNTYPRYLRREYPQATETFLTFYLMRSVALFAFSFIAYVILGNAMLLLWGVLISCSILATELGNFLLVESIRESALIGIVSAIINVLLLAAMFFLCPQDILFAYMVYIVKELVIIVGSLRFIHVRPTTASITWQKCIDLMTTGFVPMLTNLLIIVNYRIDVIMLERMGVDFHAIGLYTVGASLAEYCWVIPDAFKEVIMNRTAKEQAVGSVMLSLRLSLTALLIIFLFMLGIAKPLITFAYGVAYTESYKITLLLFTGIYAMVFTKLLGVAFLAEGKSSFYFLTLLIASLLNVLGNFLVIPKLGIYGAAITSVVTYTIAGTTFLHKYLHSHSLRLCDALLIRRTDVTKLLSFGKSVLAKEKSSSADNL